jgi:hypothetical protein
VAHEFDSGLTLPQRRKIREAIVARLREDLELATLPGSTGDLYVAAVVELAAPYRQGDGDLEEMLKEAAAGRSPMIAVALGARSFAASNTDERSWRGPLQVHVYVLSSHRGGLLTRVRGGDAAAEASNAADPGLETAMEHVFERLAGFAPPDCLAAELRPQSEDFPYVADDFTVAEIVFEVAVQTNVNPKRARTQVAVDILTTHSETEAGDPADLDALSTLEEP